MEREREAAKENNGEGEGSNSRRGRSSLLSTREGLEGAEYSKVSTKPIFTTRPAFSLDSAVEFSLINSPNLRVPRSIFIRGFDELVAH